MKIKMMKNDSLTLLISVNLKKEAEYNYLFNNELHNKVNKKIRNTYSLINIFKEFGYILEIKDQKWINIDAYHDYWSLYKDLGNDDEIYEVEAFALLNSIKKLLNVIEPLKSNPSRAFTCRDLPLF